jgi:hypothetical protein
MEIINLAVILTLLSLPAFGQESTEAQRVELFEKKVRPVLHERCLSCHGPDKQKGGLRLDTRAGFLHGGDSGPSVVPGDPENSLLIKAVRQIDPDFVMPPRKSGKKLPEAAIADLVAWIRSGAHYPADAAPPAAKHWAFDPILDPGTKTIDADAAAAPAADRRTLIRRATFDLTGLPPSAEEVDRFVADDSPDAFARLVDRLLESPAYGEKWGRKWLDVVRYADTAGENSDFPAPHAWRYRNYVIDAFNRDKPYDRFLTEQIAGDLLAAGAPAEQKAELVTATGYLAVARRFGHDTDKDMHLTIEDVIDTLGKSVLGLTLGCARCHNHKYDPVTTRDYYALYGIFASTRFPFPGCEAKQKPRDLVPLPSAGDQASRPASVSPPGFAYAVAEGKAADVRIHLRGEPDQSGEVAPRRNLAFLGGQAIADPASSGRLDLAAWLTDGKNPLPARVMANRIWQGHFGRGIVETPSDFGTRGAKPSNPELLDLLAVRFRTSGWSMKALHRLIMNSAAYRTARFPRRRLDAEEIRDSLLVASGELDLVPGGSHPFPPEDKWKYTQHAPFKAVYDTKKRSVYLMTQRIQRHPFLALFDGADTNASTARRDVSTVPTQALYFMNDPFVHARSDALAKRLLALPREQRVEAAHRICFQRPSTDAEQRGAEAFLEACAKELGAGREAAAWSAYARTLLASNEFITVD